MGVEELSVALKTKAVRQLALAEQNSHERPGQLTSIASNSTPLNKTSSSFKSYQVTCIDAVEHTRAGLLVTLQVYSRLYLLYTWVGGRKVSRFSTSQVVLVYTRRHDHPA